MILAGLRDGLPAVVMENQALIQGKLLPVQGVGLVGSGKLTLEDSCGRCWCFGRVERSGSISYPGTLSTAPIGQVGQAQPTRLSI